ncbi:hypothetical protein D9M72_200250 [compost metagenome]
MAEPTRPGQKCRIIGSTLGTDGHCVGKEVVTVFLHDQPLRKESGGVIVDMGAVWRVRGQGLLSEFGGAGEEVDCLAIWLEVADDPQQGKTTTTTKDLELTK